MRISLLVSGIHTISDALTFHGGGDRVGRNGDEAREIGSEGNPLIVDPETKSSEGHSIM